MQDSSQKALLVHLAILYVNPWPSFPPPHPPLSSPGRGTACLPVGRGEGVQLWGRLLKPGMTNKEKRLVCQSFRQRP